MRQTEEDAMKNICNAGSCRGKFFLRIPGRARASKSLDLLVGKREIQAERTTSPQPVVGTGANATSGSISVHPEMEVNSQPMPAGGH